MSDADFAVYDANGVLLFSAINRSLRLLRADIASGTGGTINIASGVTEGTLVVGSVGSGDQNHNVSVSESGDTATVTYSAVESQNSRVTALVY